MKRILFIPHHPGADGIKIRINEIAKAMANRHEVYLLTWNYVHGEYSMMNRIAVTLKDLFKLPSITRQDGLCIVEFPTLHRPVALARLFNRLFLMRFIRRMKIDTVVNGSYYLFTVPARRPFTYIVDIADLPADASAPYVDRFTRNESRKADAVTVVSHGLADYVKNDYGCPAQYIPNGVDMRRMQTVTAEETAAVREKYALTGKYVVGYIGYIGSWVNVELAIQAFRLFQQSCPDSSLLFIGASRNINELREQYASPAIIFTGPVHGHIEPYFKALDMGILPHRKSLFQDMAFHLKLIEYTAAGKPIVSTPLDASMRLKFANIIFSDESESAWAGAMLRAKDMKADASWARQAEAFDWQAICETFETLL